MPVMCETFADVNASPLQNVGYEQLFIDATNCILCHHAQEPDAKIALSRDKSSFRISAMQKSPLTPLMIPSIRGSAVNGVNVILIC